MDYESQVLAINDGGTVAPLIDPGFDNKPVKRVRPEMPVLDGSKDIYLRLRVSDKPVFDFFGRPPPTTMRCPKARRSLSTASGSDAPITPSTQ